MVGSSAIKRRLAARTFSRVLSGKTTSVNTKQPKLSKRFYTSADFGAKFLSSKTCGRCAKLDSIALFSSRCQSSSAHKVSLGVIFRHAQTGVFQVCFQLRTVYCGEVSDEHENTEQTFAGWIKFSRGLSKFDFGFFVLSDYTGDLQFVVSEDVAPIKLPNEFSWANLTPFSCLALRGKVCRRPQKVMDGNFAE